MTSVAAGASIALQLLQPVNGAAGRQPDSAVEIVEEIAAQSSGDKQKSQTSQEDQGSVTPIVSVSPSSGAKDAAGKINTAMLDGGAQTGNAAKIEKLDGQLAYLKGRLATLQSDTKEDNSAEIESVQLLISMTETQKKLVDVGSNGIELAKKIEANWRKYLEMTPEERRQYNLDAFRGQIERMEENLAANPTRADAPEKAKEIERYKEWLRFEEVEWPRILEGIRTGNIKPTEVFDRDSPGVGLGYDGPVIVDHSAKLPADLFSWI